MIKLLRLNQFNSYFAEEVLHRQSENNRKVLFVCSLFYQFSKALIENILTKIDPGFPINEITGALMNKNNFTISLDSSNTWFGFTINSTMHLNHTLKLTPIQNKKKNACNWVANG